MRVFYSENGTPNMEFRSGDQGEIRLWGTYYTYNPAGQVTGSWGNGPNGGGELRLNDAAGSQVFGLTHPYSNGYPYLDLQNGTYPSYFRQWNSSGSGAYIAGSPSPDSSKYLYNFRLSNSTVGGGGVYQDSDNQWMCRNWWGGNGAYGSLNVMNQYGYTSLLVQDYNDSAELFAFNNYPSVPYGWQAWLVDSTVGPVVLYYNAAGTNTITFEAETGNANFDGTASVSDLTINDMPFCDAVWDCDTPPPFTADGDGGGESGWHAQQTSVSPSSGMVWFEDAPAPVGVQVGEGRLDHGRAWIELDPDFMATVVVGADQPMMVYLTPMDDCNGLYVKRGTSGFEAIELNGGTSDASFAFRVVAKRQAPRSGPHDASGTPEQAFSQQPSTQPSAAARFRMPPWSITPPPAGPSEVPQAPPANNPPHPTLLRR
jgi:hypothetical protein